MESQLLLVAGSPLGVANGCMFMVISLLVDHIRDSIT